MKSQLFLTICAVVLGCLGFVVQAQEMEMVNVSLKVGENLEYDISMIPTMDGVRSISQKFCQERRGDFGIAEDNLIACIEPVMDYLSQYVPKKPEVPVPQEEDFTVPLKVGETEFKIKLQPNEEAAVATALTFCEDHGARFGITEATFVEDCLNPVGAYLKGAAEAEAKARAGRRAQLAEAEEAARQLAALPDDVTIPMKIAGLTYSIAWNSRRTNARNIAIKFCTEQGENINASFDDCLGPVEAHLTQQAALLLQSKEPAPVAEDLRVVKAKVDVAGREFEFRFEPTEADALRVARGFCSDRGAELGVQAALAEQQCVKPVLKVLMVALDQVK